MQDIPIRRDDEQDVLDLARLAALIAETERHGDAYDVLRELLQKLAAMPPLRSDVIH